MTSRTRTAPVPHPERALAMAAALADAGAAAASVQLIDLEGDLPTEPGIAFPREVTTRRSTSCSVLAPLRLSLFAAGADCTPYDGELRGYVAAVGVACGSGSGQQPERRARISWGRAPGRR
ncbi:hypothetical protein [Kitasatospora sp. CB01950]|uniref:hypothetical protein n=1 Tax=Kitasatospora sp. CB01950 TaxID=1703930 RepID=UPI001160F25B|nr:hypothetical protein [Kitasatospora sp. CB01950]